MCAWLAGSDPPAWPMGAPVRLLPSALSHLRLGGEVVWLAEGWDGEIYVALVPLCHGLGLHGAAELQRLQRDETLGPQLRRFWLPAKGHGRPVVCLPFRLLPGWLIRLQSARLRPDARGWLVEYQRQAHAALAGHFRYLYHPAKTSTAEAQQWAILEALLGVARKDAETGDETIEGP